MAYDKLKTETYVCTGGINTKASPYATDKNEFLDLINVNFVQPGALTKRQGTTGYLGATVSGRITGGIEFERLSGASYLIVTANTNMYVVSTTSFSAVRTGLLDSALFDFVPFVDRLFAANGQDFFKTDGVNTSNYGLPPPAGYGITAAYSIGGFSAGLTGTILAAPAYVNDRGYIGPIGPGVTLTMNGASANTVFYYGLTVAPGFGVTYVRFFRTSPGGLNLFGTTLAPGAAIVSGATFADFAPLSSLAAPTNIYFTLIPRYLELFNNQLFMGGFSGALSTAVWSDVGEPESVQPEFSAEFRTNDGDRMTGLKSYSSALVVSKQRSFHRLTGDNPDNFLLQEISDQYGCLSNRAMVTWETKLWFLDSRGIVEYDGANVRVVSTKVEPIFTTMNVEAAIDNAVGIHYRQFNEVWFGIPCNGATMNNTVVVFDYVSNAWTTYQGLNISSLFLAKSALPAKVPFYGSYTGAIFSFGASLFGDAGNAITCLIKTRFQADGGQTEQRQYRRFYLNVDPILGSSQAITVNIRSDFGASIQVQRTMYQAPFQSRIDFGTPARSIQAEIVHTSATLPFRVPGYAFASRFQRDL